MSSTPASQPSKKPTRKRDAVKTREDIVFAAGRRFADAGYSRVTLQEIADDVGITAALIVRYFGSKRELFDAVSDSYAHYLPVPPDGPGGGQSLPDRFADFLVDYWQNEDARWTVMALIRSLDVEGVSEELRNRLGMLARQRITGRDAEARRRMLTALMMGFGLFGVGALTNTEPEKLGDEQLAAMTRLLSKMLSVCFEEPSAEPSLGGRQTSQP